MSEVTVWRASAEEAAAQVPALADVLIDCVHGGASVSFMAPL
ncbi:MAG: GNAT family N-acetyltransferase, partial [Rubrivivax sp.]|nr:GNAT family N-acetyltransferase [Rubrivivax sp.]